MSLRGDALDEYVKLAIKIREMEEIKHLQKLSPPFQEQLRKMRRLAELLRQKIIGPEKKKSKRAARG